VPAAREHEEDRPRSRKAPDDLRGRGPVPEKERRDAEHELGREQLEEAEEASQQDLLCRQRKQEEAADRGAVPPELIQPHLTESRQEGEQDPEKRQVVPAFEPAQSPGRRSDAPLHLPDRDVSHHDAQRHDQREEQQQTALASSEDQRPERVCHRADRAAEVPQALSPGPPTGGCQHGGRAVVEPGDDAEEEGGRRQHQELAKEAEAEAPADEVQGAPVGRREREQLQHRVQVAHRRAHGLAEAQAGVGCGQAQKARDGHHGGAGPVGSAGGGSLRKGQHVLNQGEPQDGLETDQEECRCADGGADREPNRERDAAHDSEEGQQIEEPGEQLRGQPLGARDREETEAVRRIQQAMLDEAGQDGDREDQRLEAREPRRETISGGEAAAEGDAGGEAAPGRRRHRRGREGRDEAGRHDARLATLPQQPVPRGLSLRCQQRAERAHSHDSSPPFAPPMRETNSSSRLPVSPC
jgi:hypothetical protein